MSYTIALTSAGPVFSNTEPAEPNASPPTVYKLTEDQCSALWQLGMRGSMQTLRAAFDASPLSEQRALVEMADHEIVRQRIRQERWDMDPGANF